MPRGNDRHYRSISKAQDRRDRLEDAQHQYDEYGGSDADDGVPTFYDTSIDAAASAAAAAAAAGESYDDADHDPDDTAEEPDEPDASSPKEIPGLSARPNKRAAAKRVDLEANVTLPRFSPRNPAHCPRAPPHFPTFGILRMHHVLTSPPARAAAACRRPRTAALIVFLLGPRHPNPNPHPRCTDPYTTVPPRLRNKICNSPITIGVLPIRGPRWRPSGTR